MSFCKTHHFIFCLLLYHKCENVDIACFPGCFPTLWIYGTGERAKAGTQAGRLPYFLFEAPMFKFLSSEAKVLYAFILRRAGLPRKNGWADEYGRIYLYYPICEVGALLRCGRQKAVNTLWELPYAGLVEI